MFKWIRRLIVAAVLVVVVTAVALYLSLDGIVKHEVEVQGTDQLHVPTTLGGVSLGLVHGTVALTDFALGSPPGFTAPQMLAVGGLSVDTGGLTHLRDKPIHVTTIALDTPKLVIEQKGTTLNYKALLDGLPSAASPQPTTTPPAQQPPAEQNPIRLIIDTLSINNATVQFIPDAAGLADNALGGLGALGKQAKGLADKQLAKADKPLTMTLPSLSITQIGNTDGKGQGAAIKDVAAAVIQAMVASAAKSGNLPIDPALLNGNLDSVKGKVGDAVKRQAGNLPGGAGKLLNGFLNKGAPAQP